MTNLPSTRLAGVIAAAKKLPTVTGATQAGASARKARDLGIVADVSGSMSEAAGPGKRRIDVLREALSLTLPDTGARVIAFSSTARLVEGATLPDPSGGTALHRAISLAASLGMRRLLVMSDGQPDDAGAALLAAREFGGPVDVIYCGPDNDLTAKEFMARLAQQSGGQSVNRSYAAGPRLIAQDIKRLTYV